ncbi:MAG: hypothetical protein ACLS3M_08510 [Collinsella sp.]
MDEVAELPYARDWHPDYDAAGGVPALPRSGFQSAPTAGALVNARLRPHLPPRSRCRCAATTRSCARQSCSRAIPSLRATSTT